MCPTVSGVYQPLYTPVSGNCGPISNANTVQFMPGPSGSITTTEMRLNEDVTTMIVRKGCTVSVTQTVAAKTGQVNSQMDGDTIRVQNASTLSGQVDYVKFNEFNQVACSGRYNATFQKNAVPVGAIR